MKSVNPDDLISHRAFFTEFDRYGDPTRWSTDDEMRSIKRFLERNLKLLILTKAHVVIAGSHLLESPFAHDFLLQHPKLLISGAVIPSIKIEHPSATEFLNRKREEYISKLTSPYHTSRAEEVANLIDSVATTVRWSLSSNSLLKNSISDRLFKNVQMQGAQKPRNEAYIEVFRLTRLVTQRRRWAFFNSLLIVVGSVTDSQTILMTKKV